MIECRSLSESQDSISIQNPPRLGLSSMRYAGIAHDVVHSSQSFQDIYGSLSLGSIGKKKTVCVLLEF